jgi:hypothetical protein
VQHYMKSNCHKKKLIWLKIKIFIKIKVKKNIKNQWLMKEKLRILWRLLKMIWGSLGWDSWFFRFLPNSKLQVLIWIYFPKKWDSISMLILIIIILYCNYLFFQERKLKKRIYKLSALMGKIFGPGLYMKVNKWRSNLKMSGKN